MVIQRNTKKAQRLLALYSHALAEGHFTLDDVYGRYSGRKLDAFRVIERRMESEGGSGLAIISASSSTFSTGYMLGGSLVVDTRDNTYIVPGEPIVYTEADEHLPHQCALKAV